MDGIMVKHDDDTQELLNHASDLITEIVLYGLYLMEILINDDSNEDELSKKILILMLRDMLEGLDSYSILIKNGCSISSIPILRTVLEVYLSAVFLAMDQSESNAIAYDVCHIHKKITAGEFLKQNYSDDDHSIDDTLSLLTDKLQSPTYEKYDNKWKRFYNAKGHPPNWYNITNIECTSIRKLAKQTDKLALYDTVYAHFSMYTHATMALKNYNYQENFPKIIPLRSPNMVALTCRYCLSIAADIYNRLIDRYLGVDDKANIEDWYYERRQSIDNIIKIEQSMVGQSVGQ